ncbi:MAG: hypothetical protein DCF30_16945 [Hyphomicrobiales bacterium]|nr:MAG: hypothetical protein DCF30_16945 [Hyphomicrobiales bacterium]
MMESNRDLNLVVEMGFFATLSVSVRAGIDRDGHQLIPALSASPILPSPITQTGRPSGGMLEVG